MKQKMWTRVRLYCQILGYRRSRYRTNFRPIENSCVLVCQGITSPYENLDAELFKVHIEQSCVNEVAGQILHRIKSGSIIFCESPTITSHNGWNTLHSRLPFPPLPYTSKRLIIQGNLSWKVSLEYEKPLLRTFLFIVKEHSRVKVRGSHIDFRFFQNTGNQRETQISESIRGIKSRTHKDKTKLNCQNQMKGYQSLQCLIRRKLRQHTLEVSSY